jgi:hypothetical protein
VIKQKYTKTLYVKDYIKQRNKSFSNVSTMWKVLILAFPLIGNWLAWKMGIKINVKVGIDPWIGSDGMYKLSNGAHKILK